MIHFLHLKNVSIFRQLQIEEALLRLDHRNWCIINEGSPKAIVMGISGKPHELIDLEKTKAAKIPIIKRFSGGGTVIVDEDTVFATFICQKDLHDFPPFPERILSWSAEFYKKAFKIPDFHLQENDYALKNLKCGGNAQYLRKDRWLHHTTFLWDFKNENMNYLLHPKKTPKYRDERSHLEFLCRLKTHFSSKDDMVLKIKAILESVYKIIYSSLEEISDVVQKEHRKTTEYLFEIF